MKRKCAWNECKGEAHSNIFIDNCMSCMPYWGRYPACPECKKGLKVKRGRVTGECSEHGRFSVRG